MDEVIEFVKSFDGTLAVIPGPGRRLARNRLGDAFFYYAPDGTMPKTTQPFATIVTKNYPDDERSRLNRPGSFRVNVAPGKAAFVEWTGHQPGEPADDIDPSVQDTVFAHPVYGSLGWLAVVNPGPATTQAVRNMLRKAYDLARSRYERRRSV